MVGRGGHHCDLSSSSLSVSLWSHKERDIYARVREEVNSTQRALEFLDTLAESANDYAALLNPSHKSGITTGALQNGI